MTELSRSARGYDSLAKIYIPLEFSLFGRALQRSRVALIHRLPSVENALVLGDGDGRLLESLCRAYPNCRFTSIDHSRGMLDRQRNRMQQVDAGDRIQFIRQNAKTFVPDPGTHDLLVTAYFLDCFSAEELSDHFPRWLSALRSGGLLYFVDFVHPESRPRRAQARIYQTMMHALFRFATELPNRRLLDLPSLLDRPDLDLIECSAETHPMTTCRIYRYNPPGRET